MLSRGQKHHFLQDFVHISKFCAGYQILRKIPRAQNPRGTVRYTMEGETNREQSNRVYLA